MPATSAPYCYRCQWHQAGGHFICEWPWGRWDVNAAEMSVRRLRRRGLLRRVTFSWRALRRYAERDGWLLAGHYYPPHVAHVRLHKPGIMGTLSSCSGRRLFLIEGIHRAIRCLQEGRSFVAYVLPKVETERANLEPGNNARWTGRHQRATGQGQPPAWPEKPGRGPSPRRYHATKSRLVRKRSSSTA